MASADPGRPIDVAFLRAHWSHFVALGGGSGLSPLAPGTAGTLVGWAAYRILDPWISDVGWLLVVAAGVLLGAWVSQRVIDALGVDDPGVIVWDEIVSFWLVLALVPGGSLHQAALFLLFRAFDTVKPWPIRWLDRNIKGGWGVMIDDLAAALATVITALVWLSLT